MTLDWACRMTAQGLMDQIIHVHCIPTGQQYGLVESGLDCELGALVLLLMKYEI